MTVRFLPLFLFVLTLFSCEQDACENVVCLNKGVCESGDCLCEPGFEGFNCEIEQRQAFLGNYAVDEACNLGNFAYTITISADSTGGTFVAVGNLADLGATVQGVASGNGLTVLEQVVGSSTISANGSLEDDVLTMHYLLVTTGLDTLDCSLTAVKNP